MLFSYKPQEIQEKESNFWQGKLKIDIGRMTKKKKSNQTLEEWLIDYEKESLGNMYIKISQKRIILAGKEAVSIKSKSKIDETLANFYIIIENGDYIYFINAIGDFNEENKNIFDLILSTFKFLD